MLKLKAVVRNAVNVARRLGGDFGEKKTGEACEKERKDPAKVSNLVNYYEYVTNRWVEYF